MDSRTSSWEYTGHSCSPSPPFSWPMAITSSGTWVPLYSKNWGEDEVLATTITNFDGGFAKTVFRARITKNVTGGRFYKRTTQSCRVYWGKMLSVTTWGSLPLNTAQFEVKFWSFWNCVRSRLKETGSQFWSYFSYWKWSWLGFLPA